MCPMWKLELCERASRDGFEFAIKSKREVRTARKTFVVPLRSAPPRGTDPLRPVVLTRGFTPRIHGHDFLMCPVLSAAPTSHTTTRPRLLPRPPRSLSHAPPPDAGAPETAPMSSCWAHAAASAP
jgi:hypothetical protein